MELLEENAENCVIVSVNGRLDTTNYTQLDTKLNLLADAGKTRIILDCTAMDYISSTGLRILLVALKRLSSAGGRFLLCGLQQGIREIFEISGFTRIFEIHPAREEALRSIQAGS
jgi:anti-anti-sigma factor